MLGRRQEINLQLNQLLDCGLLALSIWIAHWLRSGPIQSLWPNLYPIPPFGRFWWLVAVIAPFTPIILESRGFYDDILRKTRLQSLRQLGGAALRITVLVGLCEIFLRWNVEARSVVVVGSLLGAVALLARGQLSGTSCSGRRCVGT